TVDLDVNFFCPQGEVPGAGLSSLNSIAVDYAVVKEEPLWKVVGQGNYRINKKCDRRYTRRPVHEIIFRAVAEVRKEMTYNVFSQNCEHFVTKLRYGIPDCDQVSDGVDLAGTAIAGIVGIGAIAFLVSKVVERRRRDPCNKRERELLLETEPEGPSGRTTGTTFL
ncbi:phospholipase A and acyltransferase 3-like, partial [Sphaerodactylus townsendi]|uniref:phospholipase A and acyltransferase 3-like n=1 Tax=Sphaerodactylus townsendi TaxID=933632 RepID=UPI0020271504